MIAVPSMTTGRRVLAAITLRRCIIVFALAAVVGSGLFAMSAAGRYYLQAFVGHMQLMLARTPIDEIVRRPATGEHVRERLLLVQEIRQFATKQLALPDNDSYRQYANLERDHLLWSVTALPEFSLTPKQWCYPVIGCQSYRSYFSEERARALGQQLEAAGYAAVVRPVAAYSTLGYFADPVTAPMLRREEQSLAELIFHELAHQRVYVRGDTMFNESYANFVGEEGLRQWLRSRGEHESLARWQARQYRVKRFTELLADTRQHLESLYATELPPAEMRTRKDEILAGMRVRFERELVDDEPAMERFASWFDEPVTNARLARVALYRHWMDAFAELYRREDQDWGRFHAAVEVLADMARPMRTALLEDYLAAAGSAVAEREVQPGLRSSARRPDPLTANRAESTRPSPGR